MISGTDVYHVVSATVPLYVSMILAYISVKHIRLFTPEQCLGISKFVSKFSVPVLSFQVIAGNNPFTMNPRLILADFLQKVFAVVILAAAVKFWRRSGGLSWIIAGFSISTLPNTLVLGIPILRATYGAESVDMLVQIVVLQSLIWSNLLIFLFELNAARTSNAAERLESQNVEISEEAKEEETITEKKRGESMKILATVLKKLMTNPNTYAALAGLIWATLHFRLNLKLPEMVEGSIKLFSDGGLGMAMFSLGLFMASQTSIIACGKRVTVVTMILKFLFGPALMAAASLAMGLRGYRLRVAILQAALPQGIVPFVFAKEYNIHPEIISTGVVFGMLIALPVTLAYYSLLAL